MHIFLSGIPFNFSLFFLIGEILSHTDQALLSHIGCEKPPTSTLDYIRSPLLLIFIYMVIAMHLQLHYCYTIGLNNNFWRRSLSIKAFCGELLSSCLLLSCIHGFHHHVSSLHFHISLDPCLLS